MVSAVGRTQCGFTLLEILVAITLLAMVFTVLLRVFATGTRGMAATEDYGRATAYARTLLLKTGSEVPLVAGIQRGERSDGFRWQREIRPYDPPRIEGEAEVSGLYRIAVAVRWSSPLGEREVRLASVRLNPGETRP